MPDSAEIPCKSLNNGHLNPELDLLKLQTLSAEQQDLFILTFSANLADHIGSLDSDGASSQQIYLKKELFQIINLSSPAPTRVIRNNLGRCFAGIFGKGDRKLLFDSIKELVDIIDGGKGEKALRAKHAAVHCLGETFGAAGDSAISLSGLACSSLVKLLKPAQNHAGLRGSIYSALGKLAVMVGASLDETVARDIWKHARSSSSSEKSLVVQASALECLQKLAINTQYFDNSNDFDSLKSTIFKAIDSPASVARHAAANCLGATLVNLFSEVSSQENVSKPKKIKKTKTGMRNSISKDEEDDVPARSESPAPKRSIRLNLSLSDILTQLSNQYLRSSTSSRVRAGLASCYSKVFKGLNCTFVETSYATIVDHLLIDLLTHPNIVQNRYRLLTTRKFVRVILHNTIGRQILGESGQIAAAKVLINNILKNYPQVIKERPEPSKHTLTGALDALASLIGSLGSASAQFSDSCRDSLLQVLQHPSYTVQISTSHCLRTFVLACPQQLLPCVTICMNSVNRELNLLLTPRHSSRRCVGFANGLSAVISTAPLQPLYGSVDVNSRVLSLATGLLKSSGKSELRVSGTQIQVAWILIGGLMSLGPNFVKIHLSQLLLLWKNALPKPLAKDSMLQRSLLELSFLAHVRECALGSILAFLQFNSKLLTTDVAKRLAAMLQNTTSFLNGLPSKKTTEDVSQRLSPSLQLLDLNLMVHRRVLQCYTKLVNLSVAGSTEALLHANLLTQAVSFFAHPDSYTPSSLSTSIASSAGNFDSVWEVGDNYGFGITGLIRGFEIRNLPSGQKHSVQHHWLTRKGPDAEIDETLLSPICASREHDSVSLYINSTDDMDDLPDPPATEVVNSAISLFAISLPLQPPKVQESILEQIATFLSASSLQRDPARKAAMTVNIAIALLATLKVALKETSSLPGDLRSPGVEKILQELLREFVVHPDHVVRYIAYEALGRLCSSSGNSFTTNEINFLIDVIVTNRDPNARAGCSVALGCIHSQVGGMAAGYHLKTIVGILMSLGNDPHPTVHFWALESMSKVADSAGLTFAGYVSSTLGILAQLYMAETHDEEGASIANTNLELEFPTNAVITRCIDSLVNVLGPDLQELTKARELVLTLMDQFQTEKDPLILAESLRCLEHLSLYASGYVDFSKYVGRLQKYLVSPNRELRDVAIDGLYNLMKRDAKDVVKAAEEGLEEQLWLALDDTPCHDGIQNIWKNWLQQSSLTDTAVWLQRCQTVLTKSRSKQEIASLSKPKSLTLELQDEEVAGFAVTGDGKDESTAPPQTGQEPLKWQVRTFAMNCLSDLLDFVSREASSERISPAKKALQMKIAEIIRMAFSSSTSNVVELRIWGLRIIDQILQIFGKSPDPDFPEASLLEQYQAQISSALTPAFAADSSPELASEAINVCAAFIATGIVTDIDRMGRILKLLVSALENFSSDSDTAAIGDLKGLSSNAQVMVKMAVYSAWAELQVASGEQLYLVNVMKPHIATLTPLWLSSLREFARLRFEPDISMNAGPAALSGSLDTIYAAMNRETLLKFYQDSWLDLVDAIASLIEQDSEFVFDALDGKTELTSPNGTSKSNDINYRDEPVAFFFVLFGIAFEALASRSGGDTLASKGQTLGILLALKKILLPSVSGHAIYQEVIFSETMDLLDRLVLTEGLDVQAVIVRIARSLCLSHPSARAYHEAAGSGENLSEDIDQLFELTRIIVLVLSGLLPNLTGPKSKARHQLSDEAVSLVRTSLEALVDAAQVFPAIIKTDLHACIIHTFSITLSTGACQALIIPQSLPIFKRFVQTIARSDNKRGNNTSIQIQIRGSLKRFLTIITNAQKREAETDLSCVKNSLLATTILITGSANILPPNDPLITKFLEEVLDCLTDRMTATVAANCIRSLLLLTPSTPTSQSIARHLLPRLVAYLTASAAPDPENIRPLIAHALTSFSTTLESTHQSSIYFSLLVPALLSRASKEGEVIHRETALRLTELAKTNQVAFRAIIGGMDGEQKSFIEAIIRRGASGAGSSLGENAEEKDETEAAPTIALRMNFMGKAA
ncbi:MAG: hypothetical protein M1829_004406 [Trizodia sp. TS-e1964]|nr:MAG: hypothetical protein M1829_004406 [Trizodia sp. TS-e1964]